MALLLLAAACSSSDDDSNGTAPNADAGNGQVVGQNQPSVDGGPTTSPNGDDSGPAAPTPDAGADADAAPVVDLAPYRIIGRYDTRSPDGPRFGWSGTQVRARFHGASIAIQLVDSSGDDQFDVSIDGAAPTLLTLTGQRGTYTFGNNDANADHEFVLTKRTESTVGVAQLVSIDGNLIGTPGLDGTTRRIEMIGDSITNGYGVLGADQTCSFSPGTEDEGMAWGALTASQLNAVHTAIAWSGIGVYRNYDQTLTGTMPDHYALSVATDDTSTWDATQFEPDVIVVNLGTNDFAGANADPGPNFQSAMVTFLGTIRTAHPNAPIIVASSPMLTSTLHAQELAYLQGAVAARNTAGDTKLSVIDIPVQDGTKGYGCDWHPSAGTHQAMATQLVAQIKSVTGW